MAVLFVAAGGACGAVLRYLFGLIPIPGAFPVITLGINLVGALAIGAISEAALGEFGISERSLLFLKTGFAEDSQPFPLFLSKRSN